MVDVHSIVASSHPSCRERESERETTSRSRAGRSRWVGGHADTTTIVLESQPERTTGTTAPPPATVGIDVTLLAACQLLNNPPPSEAPPSADEQWCHNVDQLVVAAINTPHYERRRQPSAQQSHTPSMVHVPFVVHAPPVLPNACPSAQHRAPMVSYMTTYLREEINHHRGGKDSLTAIERHHKRQRNIEDRDLEKDFDSHAPLRGGPVAHVPHPPNSLRILGGWMTLAPHLRMMVWPHKF
jgi:hypothetical protein